MTNEDLLRHLKDVFDNYSEDAAYYAYEDGKKFGFDEAYKLAQKVITNNCSRESMKEHLLRCIKSEFEDYKLENF